MPFWQSEDCPSWKGEEQGESGMMRNRWRQQLSSSFWSLRCCHQYSDLEMLRLLRHLCAILQSLLNIWIHLSKANVIEKPMKYKEKDQPVTVHKPYLSFWWLHYISGYTNHISQIFLLIIYYFKLVNSHHWLKCRTGAGPCTSNYSLSHQEA